MANSSSAKENALRWSNFFFYRKKNMIESDHHQLNDDNICIIGKKNEILEREKKDDNR